MYDYREAGCAARRHVCYTVKDDLCGIYLINITTGGSGPPRLLGVRVYTSIIPKAQSLNSVALVAQQTLHNFLGIAHLGVFLL